MRRVHLVELEDLRAVPAAIRDGGTDLLDLSFERAGIYRKVAPKLADVIERTNVRSVLDLCSGGGGGTLSARRALGGRLDGVRFVLTDLHPSATGRARVAAMNDALVRYESRAIDALDGGGDDANAVRTMSGALHHFRPQQVTELLAAIVRRRAPIVFFDVAASPAMRRIPAWIAPIPVVVNMLFLVLAALFLMPFVRPVRASNLVLTYVVPLIPLLVAWDGTVSALRAYSPDELLALARSVPDAERYEWESDVRGRALFLVGIPSESAAETTHA